MAYGIEEIAKMQVTGPVQGGDMIMKPDQAPVGAAALLNKMQNKNTPGIFKLPMPDKEMPNFMKVAAEGVEQQTAKGDTINQMAGALLRQGINIQGMGMDEIIQIYEQTFGSPGDVDEFGVSQVAPDDWRTILKMIQSGMSEEEIEAQMAMNTMKNRVRKDIKKVEAFAPEGEQLAYINKDEAEVLKMMGGSGEREPITGIKTFRNAYVSGQHSALGADASDNFTPQEKKQFQAAQDEKAYQTEASGGDIGDYNYTSSTVEKQADRAAKHHKDTGQHETVQDYGHEDVLAQIAENEAAKKIVADKEDGTLSDALSTITGLSTVMAGTDTLAKWLRDNKIKNVKEFIKSDKSGAGWANLLNQFKSRGGDKNFQEWFEGEEGAWKDTMLQELKDDPGMEDIKDTSYEEVLEFMKTKHGGSEEWKKRFGETKAEWWKENPAQTGNAAEDMVQNLTMNDIQNSKLSAKEKRRLMQDLQQARDTVSENREQYNQKSGTGAPVEKITEEEEEVVTTTTDPRAGQFNVGGTMPYSDALYTQGTEIDVPLGRRFEIDKDKRYLASNRTKDDIYKYATEGGYSQLEPFQNYLARRREYLGEDEPQYFDEEGKVIYSDSETV